MEEEQVQDDSDISKVSSVKGDDIYKFISREDVKRIMSPTIKKELSPARKIDTYRKVKKVKKYIQIQKHSYELYGQTYETLQMVDITN